MINFNVPPYTGKELDYISRAVENQKICGDGEYTKKCNAWIEEKPALQNVCLQPPAPMPRSWRHCLRISNRAMR